MGSIQATQLDLNVDGLVVPEGLRIARVEIRAARPLVQVSPFLLPEGMQLDIQFTALARDIQAYLEARRPGGLSGFSVKAEGGKLTIIAIARIIVPVEVGAEGVLEFSEGKLNFVPSRVEVGGMNAPGIARQQLDRVNPVIDLTGWPVDTRLKEVTIEEGEIRLAATLTLTAAIPRREP